MLGSMLLDNSTIPRVAAALRPADLYSRGHQAVYEAILALHGAAQPVDLVTLVPALATAGQLVAVGGVDALIALQEGVPSAARAADYARRVAELAQRRRVLERIGHARTVGLDPTASASDVAIAAEEVRAAATAALPGAAPTPAAAADFFQFKQLAASLNPRPPTSYIVESLIARPSLVIIYGQPGCFKSFLASDMGLCIAAGISWLPTLYSDSGSCRNTIQTPVGWWDYDNGERRTEDRLEALVRGHSLTASAASIPFFYSSMSQPTLNAADPSHIRNLVAAINSRSNGRPVLGANYIDNLGIISGGVDENSSDMIGVLAGLRHVVTATNATLQVLAHERKAEGLAGRMGDRLRGHTSIRGAVDLLLHVERGTGADTHRATIQSDKSRDIDVPPFSVEFHCSHRPDPTFPDRDSNDLDHAIFYAAPDEHAPLDQAILEAVKRHWETEHRAPNGSRIKKLVAVACEGESFPHSKSVVDHRLASLVRRHKLITTKDLDNANVYNLPDLF